MKKIPATEKSLVLRTDFSDESAWHEVCAAIQQPVGDFRAYVDFVNDPDFAGIDSKEVSASLLGDPGRVFAFIIDHVTLSQAEHPILVVDVFDEPGRTFRVIPSEAWSVENNLSLANMDFGDFANSVDADGVFRGFLRP
jgi:hypothetical protein